MLVVYEEITFRAKLSIENHSMVPGSMIKKLAKVSISRLAFQTFIYLDSLDNIPSTKTLKFHNFEKANKGTTFHDFENPNQIVGSTIIGIEGFAFNFHLDKTRLQ
jgi:hypothetical protein